MLDDSLSAQGRAASTGTIEQKLAYRRQLMRDGQSAGIDYSIPHRYELDDGRAVHAYGQKLARLRANCYGAVLQPFHKGVVRPLTFAETMRARLECGGPLLWDFEVDSCTGVLYKGKPRRGVAALKIIQMSEHLLRLPDDFHDFHYNQYTPVAFDAVETEETFRVRDGQYEGVRTPAQLRNHRLWLAAAGYDQKLLNEYIEMAVAKAQAGGHVLPGGFMSFGTMRALDEDQLRSLSIGYAGLSDASGSGLGGVESFVRVIPR